MPSRPVRFGEALSRGFGAARRAPGVVGLALLSEVGSDLLSVGATVTLGGLVLGALGRTLGRDPAAALLEPELAARTLLGQLFERQTLLPVAGAVVVAGLLSLALRLLWFTSGARTFGLALGGQPAPKAMAAASHLHRSVPVAALFLPIYAAVALYDFAAIGSGWLAYLKALETGSGGFSGALALSLAASLTLLVGFLADALLRLALVRAVTLEVGPVDAVAGAARLLGANAAMLLGLSVTFGLLGSVASFIGASGGALVLGSGPAAVALVLYARALTGLVGSAVRAFLQTAELGAYAAVDAGERGVLPEPPPKPEPPPPPKPPEPFKPLETVMVIQTEPVLETQLVQPPAPEGEKKA